VAFQIKRHTNVIGPFNLVHFKSVFKQNLAEENAFRTVVRNVKSFYNQVVLRIHVRQIVMSALDESRIKFRRDWPRPVRPHKLKQLK
jgi:hypothetical protein